MEKKEILDQSGVTFKGLFIVFKRFWYLLLAIVILCGTCFTLLDTYKNRYRKYTYTSGATLYLYNVSNSELKTTYERLSAYLNDPMLKQDVQYKKIQSLAQENGVTSRVYDYVDQSCYDNGLINVYGGVFYLIPTGTETFYIYFSSYSMTPAQVQATLNQVCKSLTNLLGYSWLVGDTMQSVASSNLEGKVFVSKDGAYLPSSPTIYKNPKAPIIGIALGLLLSAALILIVYKLDDTIKSKEELERLTGVMFITYIEDIGETKEKGASNS